MSVASLLTPDAITAFVEILFIDIVLAGDNAIVVGALAAGLPAEQRTKVIMIGVLAALVLRIAFALIVTQLLQIVGLVLAGGLLLLWVAWRMWRELRHTDESPGSRGDRRRRAFGPRSREELRQRGVGRRPRRRQHEPRQCPRGRRGGPRASVGPGFRPDPVGAADGRRGQFHRPIHRALSLDRVGRAGGDPLGRAAR